MTIGDVYISNQLRPDQQAGIAVEAIDEKTGKVTFARLHPSYNGEKITLTPEQLAKSSWVPSPTTHSLYSVFVPKRKSMRLSSACQSTCVPHGQPNLKSKQAWGWSTSVDVRLFSDGKPGLTLSGAYGWQPYDKVEAGVHP